MDDHRFDDLAKSLATTSRRRAARLLVVGLIGAVAAPVREAAAACVRLNRACGPGKKCCAGTACRSGRCRCLSGVPCAGRCCPAGQRCVDGRCSAACVPEARATTCGEVGCGVKRNNCGQEIDCGACVCTPRFPADICRERGCGVKSDGCGGTFDCGPCDFPNTVCNAAGFCVCPAPFRQCGPVCVDTETDSEHCGRCERWCRNSVCRGGARFSRACPAQITCDSATRQPCNSYRDCHCMSGSDGGVFCGQSDRQAEYSSCTGPEDCPPVFGAHPGCVEHPDRCGQGLVCVATCKP